MSDRPRYDLSSFDGVRPPVGAPPAREAVERRQDALRGAAELRSQLTELAGTAESDDGRISAEVTAAGLSGLTLDPRAMRLPSEDLAAQIVRVAAAARADLDARRAELVRAAGLSAVDLDPEQVRAQLAEVTEAFRRDSANIGALIERLRTGAGR